MIQSLNDSNPSDGEDRDRAERFIKRFFDARGNIAWTDRKADSSQGQRIAPELELLRDWRHSDTPVVLPRRREKNGALTAYVIAHDRPQATMVAELLTAFVGPSYSSFDGLPARLDPADPIDQAVREFTADDALIFKVPFPTTQVAGPGWRALDLFIETTRQRPHRTVEKRKPIGRLLGEFDVALAAGEAAASADLFNQIENVGGLSAANLAYLKIKRLARLGQDAELLGRVAGLVDIVAAEPPAPIRDAILAAIFTTALASPLEDGDLSQAKQALLHPSIWVLVPGLLQGATGRLSGEALATMAVAASVLDNVGLLARVLGDPQCRDSIQQAAPLLAELFPEQVGTAEDEHDGRKNEPDAPDPGSWTKLARAIATGDPMVRHVLDGEVWRKWGPLVTEDQAVAELLGGLDDESADRAWALAGPFIDAGGYDAPAGRTARAFLRIALYHDHFSPGDLAGIIALTEIVLRSGPSDHDYGELLDELEAESSRWVSPERASAVLDLADLLIRAGRPANAAQLGLAVALLSPLCLRASRLEPDQVRFARQLSEELETGLEWPERDAEDADGGQLVIPAARVLLYSMMESVLERTKAALEDLVPGVDVRCSHDKVGSPRLKEQARGSDVIILATSCATHAATGFIQQHASDDCLIGMADGSGSASLLRAAIAKLREQAGI